MRVPGWGRALCVTVGIAASGIVGVVPAAGDPPGPAKPGAAKAPATDPKAPVPVPTPAWPPAIRDLILPETSLPAGWKKLPPGPAPEAAKAALEEVRAAARAAGRKVEVVERSYAAGDGSVAWAYFVGVDGDAAAIAKSAATAAEAPGVARLELGSPARFLLALGADAPRKALLDAEAEFVVSALVKRVEASASSPAGRAEAVELAEAALRVDPHHAVANALAGLALLSTKDATAPARAAAHLKAALASDAHGTLDDRLRARTRIALGAAWLAGTGDDPAAREVLTEAAAAPTTPEDLRTEAVYHLARALARLRDVDGAFARLTSVLEAGARGPLPAAARGWSDAVDFAGLRADPRWEALERTYVERGTAFPGRSRRRAAREAKDSMMKAAAAAWLRANGAEASPAADEAVMEALRWLKAHQRPDGGWSPGDFGRWCDGAPVDADSPGPGRSYTDLGVSGLALLAFLGAGYGELDPDPEGFHRCVTLGLDYLTKSQDADGCIGTRDYGHFVYGHAATALAAVEAYGMSRSRARRALAQKALDFTVLARNPRWGWGYGLRTMSDPKVEAETGNDTSITAWMSLVIHCAKMVNAAEEREGRAPLLALPTSPQAFEGALSWIERVTDDEGRAGYQVRGSGGSRFKELAEAFPSELGESSTAEALCCRLTYGQQAATTPAIRRGVRLLRALPPSWTSRAADFCYWYFGALALHELGGDAWTQWDARLRDQVLPHQVQTGTYCALKGSWDPTDAWGQEAGRVYATALLALTLETPYRRPGAPPAPPAVK